MSWNDYSLEKKSELTALADAIRTKSGASGNLTIPQMKDKVDEISACVELPTLTNPSTPSDVMSGKQYINGSGQAETGTFSLDSELTAQDSLISQIKNALQGKAAGGGSSGGNDTMLKGLIERSVTEFEIPQGTTSISTFAFYFYQSLRSVTIPDSVTSIGNNAFTVCDSLTSVTIGNSVTSIGDQAFMGCTGLTSVTIPDSVTSIGSSAFSGCYRIVSAVFKGTPTTINSSAFNACSALTDIYVPWSEGAVANAPWGATNAQIHYNSEV